VPTTSVENAPPIIRPYIDPGVCGAGAASESDFRDYTLYPFAVTREAPIPLQVIAEPVDGVAHPFAVAIRLFHTDRDFSSDQMVVINGASVSISVSPNGNGQAAWELPDGSTAYVRSRDLDLLELTALVARLTPREPTAAVPGFDLQRDPSDPDGLRLLYEHLNTGLAGTVKTFQCQTSGGQHIYRIHAIGGDPVSVYFGILDGPRPYSVGANGSGAITIYGVQDPAAPALQQVTNADRAGGESNPTAWRRPWFSFSGCRPRALARGDPVTRRVPSVGPTPVRR
jgi:hypothetical protein